MRSLLRYFGPYKQYLLLAALCNLLMSAFMVVSIPVLQPFLKILFEQPQGGTALAVGSEVSKLEAWINGHLQTLIETQGREQALLIVCAFLVFVFFGKNLFRYLSLYFLAPVRNFVVRDLRDRLVGKILDLPVSYFTESRKGDLMSRISADVQEIDWSIVGMVESVAREPLVILGSIAFMVVVSPSLLLFVLGLMLFSALIIGGVGRSLRRQSGEAQKRLGGIASMVEETLGGLRIIKGFNAEPWQGARFHAENTRYAEGVIGLSRRRDLASPLSEFLGITAVAVLLWFGAKQVFSGSIGAATFITFLYAFYNVIEPAKAISGAVYSIRKGMGAWERVQAVLDAPISIHDAPDARTMPEFKTGIEFEDVSFQYQNAERPAVRNLTFALEKGKVLALVGASGAGKSTVADLLPRFYDPTSGQILVDGVNLRDLRLRDLRQHLGIVSQEAVLFNDTVRNNIAFGNDRAQAADIVAAAKAANAHDFIVAMPQGYDSNIGDRGSKLSGGQRQRLTIARALLKNPPILILDEATSALDSESEKLVQLALDHLLKNRTALVIAHRLSTVQHADEIIVMDEGRIVERGTHETLMAQNGAYRRLVELQAIG